MKIAIWGLGVSGFEAIKYLCSEKKHEIFVINQGNVDQWYSEKDLGGHIDKKQCFAQSDSQQLKDSLDLIIMSPGIDPRLPEVKALSHIKTICDIEYVSSYIKKPIIAVTGTNGKTSTVTMIHDALELAGHRVFLGGNIGLSPFKAMDDISDYDFFIFELSSFQLELMDQFRPKVAAILNISQSHMERYDRFEDYIKAKVRITLKQTEQDLILLPEEFMELETFAEKKLIKGLTGFDFKDAKVIGDHMRENFFVTYETLKKLNIIEVDSLMQKFIPTFTGVKYRLEYQGTLKGVDFYNDAKSTNTASTISALNSLGNKNVALILGGKLRDETQDFLPGLKKSNATMSLFVFGESRDYLREQLEDSYKVISKEGLDDLIEQIVFSEYDVVLFSPGFPSFDQYKNYIERGDHFNKIIEKLF